MKNKILFVALLIILSALNFSWADGVPWTKEDEEFAMNFLEKLRQDKPELFRIGNLLSKKFIGVQYADEFGNPNWGNRIQYNFEYQFSSGWCTAKVILSVRKKEDRLLGYKICPTSKSVDEYYFRFSGNEIISQGTPGYPGKYFLKTFEDGEIRRAEILEEVDTNMGTLRVVRKESNSKEGFYDESDLVLNYKEIYGFGGPIRIYGVFYLHNCPHILIGVSCSGTGCRVDDLILLIMDANGKTKEIKTDDFYSEDNSIKATLKGNEIIVDLGLYKGKTKTAIYVNSEIKILYKKLPYKPLTAEQCTEFYEIAKGCVQLRELGINCDKSAVDFFGISNSDTWGLRYISNEPGFNQKLFDTECLTACKTGKLSGYNTFSKRLCGRRVK